MPSGIRQSDWKNLSRGVIPISLRHQQGVKPSSTMNTYIPLMPPIAILQDILSKLGPLRVIEEEQAAVHFHQKHYKEALNIYERILPTWNPPLEKLDIGPLEGYRRAAACAAHLDDWEKAATPFWRWSKKSSKESIALKEYIGLYADAGFAHFKAGNMLDSVKSVEFGTAKIWNPSAR